MSTRTLATAVLLIGNSHAFADVLNVPGEYPTIQAAIDAKEIGIPR
jgi:hypothetical protein